jgi:hypothetical protein
LLSNPSLSWLEMVQMVLEVLEVPRVLQVLLLEVLPVLAVLEVLDRLSLELPRLLQRLRLQKRPLLPPLPRPLRLRSSPPRLKPTRITPAPCVALQRRAAPVLAYASMDNPATKTQPPLIRSTAPLNCALEAKSSTLAPCAVASATAAMSLSRRPTHLSL